MVSVFCSQESSRLKTSSDDFRILLYGSPNNSPAGFAIGNSFRNEIVHLNLRPTQRAFDFLTIALSVVAADSFILRSDYGVDGFSRRIKLTVALGHPDAWIPVKQKLETALCFLTGDKWIFNFVEGGERTVTKLDQTLIRKFNNVHQADSVCLFSGGMDSFIGAIQLNFDNQSPVLVSRSSTGDKMYQDNMAALFPNFARFVANDSPWSPHQNELSSRSRSILFIALAGIVCSCLSTIKPQPIPLIIPENGFIALNPPLNTRRIGANSTRTAHPHYLGLLQEIFSELGLPISIQNPYMLLTKGEMLEKVKGHETEIQSIANTVSCGHWKRGHVQCGRCWPCLIRRSAFLRADVLDETNYETNNFKEIIGETKKGEDVRAALYAIQQFDQGGLQSNPLRSIREISNGLLPYADYMQVAMRGFEELREFLFEKEVWS